MLLKPMPRINHLTLNWLLQHQPPPPKKNEKKGDYFDHNFNLYRTHLFGFSPNEVLLVVGKLVDYEGAVFNHLAHGGDDIERGRGALFGLYEPGVDLGPHKLPFYVDIRLKHCQNLSIFQNHSSDTTVGKVLYSLPCIFCMNLR